MIRIEVYGIPSIGTKLLDGQISGCLKNYQTQFFFFVFLCVYLFSFVVQLFNFYHKELKGYHKVAQTNF